MKILRISMRAVIFTQTLTTANAVFAKDDTEVCEAGLTAFQRSTYELVQSRSSCVGCHDGSNSRAPAWASSQIVDSYFRMKNYVDFTEPNRSALVVRAGNGHCGMACRNETFVTELLNSIGQWWFTGEQSCETFLVSSQLQVPEQVRSGEFVTMIWPLASLLPALSGSEISLEIKGIPGLEIGSLAGYTVRRPRIKSQTGVAGCLHVKNLQVLLNGDRQWFANGFSWIDTNLNLSSTVVEPGVLISDESITLESRQSPDALAVGVKEITLEARECP